MHKKDHKYLILVKILANPVAYIDVLQTEKAVSMWRTTGLTDLSPIYVKCITLFILYLGGGVSNCSTYSIGSRFCASVLKSVLQVPFCLKSVILLTKYCNMYRIKC